LDAGGLGAVAALMWADPGSVTVLDGPAGALGALERLACDPEPGLDSGDQPVF
jgi:hypothetical protein